MKVLIVNTVNFGGNGITSVIMNYYRKMNKEGLQIDFIVTSEINMEYRREIEKNNSRIYYIKRPKNLRVFMYMRELYKLIKKNRYDIIHIHGNSALMAIETVTSFLGRVPVRIIHSHNTTCDYPILHKLLSPILNLTYTHGFACGDAAGKWLFKKDKFELIKNGIELGKFSYDETVRAIYRNKIKAGNKTVIGHIGNFVYQKNHEFLIDIFNELIKVDKDYILLLISDGYLLDSIKEKVEKLGIEKNVIFLGKTSEVNGYLQAMDIFLLPSHFEGLPVVLIEAQAIGLPCLVSDQVSSEANLTDSIEFISISNVALWVNKILKQELSNRQKKSIEHQKEIERAGYNVDLSANKMRQLYINYLDEKC